jgi:RNA polymerase sigma-70 factor (ECF subfamily)
MRSRVEPDRPVPEETDEDLARASAGGSERAFEDLVRRHQRGVYALARRFTRNHEDADDVAQESLLRAWRGIAAYDPSRPFRPWLYRIVVNTALNHLRAVRSRKEDELGEPDGLPAPPDSSGSDPEREWSGEAAARAVHRAMARLRPEERAILHLRLREEMNYRDMAGTLGVRIGTVMSRLSRARDALRRELAREGIDA